LKQADVKVTLDTVATTAFTFANATTLSFTTAPANGVAIRIFRDTTIDTLSSTFFPGSAIKAEDLNENFTQNLYVTQESDAEAALATTTANGAVTTANNAVTTANGAVTTANSANTKSDAAVATSNTAETNSNTAVATANTANTNSTNAVTTANTASTNATTAVNTANAATTTANNAVTSAATANTTAGNAVTTANSAVTTANGAVTTANTALANAATATTTANGAVTTANSTIATADSAVTTANSAVTTANTANTNATAAVNTANAAAATVASTAFYAPLAALANLPSSPSNEDRVEIINSTGVESNSAVSGVPSGFVGSTDLTVRLQYDSSPSVSKWVWQQYFAADPENRYLTESLPIVKGDSTNGSGQITLNCENNSHGIKIKGPPHSAGANYTLTLPNDTGTTGQALKTDGSGTLSFADVSSSFITQTDFAYKPTSNTLTLPTYLNIVGVSGIISSGEYYVNNIGGYAHLWFSPSDTQVKDALNTLSVGDSVTIDYTTSHGTNQFWAVTWTTTITQLPIVDTGIGNLQVKFGGGWSVNVPTSGSVSIYSAQMSNGTAPIANNQVLRYKTATSKWTVDTADASFIETPQSISVDKVIAASTNAGMMGPTVSINSGISITVGANSQLTVLN
jgi:hypothetical protein